MANFYQQEQKVNNQYNADNIEVNHSAENKKGAKYAPQTCALCKGKGKEGWLESNRCRACGGKGSVLVLQPPQQCPYCKGNGKGSFWESTDPCPTCNGIGWVHIIND